MTSLQDDITAEERIEAEVVSQTRHLRSQVQTLTNERQELQKLLGFYSATRQASIAPPTWKVSPTKGSAHAGLVVAQLTDLHFDEVVKPEEVMFLNAYNREIALLRFRSWAEKVVALPRSYFRGVRLDGLVIPATGDVFTGDIHAELKQTNEDKLMATLLFWMEPMIAALEMLDHEYAGHVSVHAVVGNHGRLSDKPIFKGRAHDNVEWLYWSVVRDRLADRKSRVVVEVSDATDLNVPIYGRNHLLTHGDAFHGGTGISGAMAPLLLGQHRKGVRQEVAKMPMELMVLGHGHQYLDLPGVIMGGSMKGYDEYAFHHNFRPETAKQALWVTTPERGKIMSMPVELQDRPAERW